MVNRTAGLILAVSVVASIAIGYGSLVYLQGDPPGLRMALWKIIGPPDEAWPGNLA
jgi:hypothetical protein